MNKGLKGLAIAATLIMFLVMIAGSLVTKTGSGLGCGNDWPLCNGKFVPEYTIESIIEYSHRMITGIAGLIVLVFSVAAWWKNRGNREVLALAWFAAFFIILESGLGASAVMWPQSSTVMALHFGFSLLAYTGVFLMTVHILQIDKAKQMITAQVSRGFRLYAWFVAVFAYGVIYLGAYVRHTMSYLACTGWPLCNGQVLPELTGQVGIQMMHRMAAATLFFLMLGMLIYAVRHFKHTRPDLYKACIAAFVLITMQVLSGGYVVLSFLQLYATMLHSAIITVLFGVLGYICVQALKKPQA